MTDNKRITTIFSNGFEDIGHDQRGRPVVRERGGREWMQAESYYTVQDFHNPKVWACDTGIWLKEDV